MAVKYTGAYITYDTEADILAANGRAGDVTYDTEADILAANGRAGDVAYALDTDLRYKSNGTNWFPTDALRVLKGTTPVNLLSQTAQKFLTIPNTIFRFVVLGAHIEVLTLTGTIVTQATVAVGTNSPNYNNLFTSGLLAGTMASVGLTSTDSLSKAQAAAALAGAIDVYAKVNVNTVGPSVYTARFDLMGYFEV